MKYLLSLLAFSLFLSCSSQKTEATFTKIEYEAGPCFGFCPMYKMTIDSNRNAVLEAERFNFSQGNSREDFSKPREGTFTTKIKAEDYAKLNAMLIALNAKSLKNYYGDKNITDLPTSYLRLNFADGSNKVIQDYGKSGTPELEEIYQFFESLKKTQTWTKKSE